MGWPADLDLLTAADVMHQRLTYLPADSTVADVRAYFDESDSHHLALLGAPGQPFSGSVSRTTIADDIEGDAAAAAFAAPEPSIAPSAPAAVARELGLEQESLRLPVVDAEGRLVGIVAINRYRSGFCGASR